MAPPKGPLGPPGNPGAPGAPPTGETTWVLPPLPTVRNVNSVVSTASLTTQVLHLTASVGTGIVILINGTTITSIKDTSGNVYLRAIAGATGNGAFGIWYCPYNQFPNPTITVTQSNSPSTVYALEVVGANPQFFLDCAAQINTAGASPLTASLRTSSPGDLIITFEVSNNSSTNTPPAGYSVKRQTTAATGNGRITVAWNDATLTNNTAGPSWTNTGGAIAGVASFAIRSARAQPNIPLTQTAPVGFMPGSGRFQPFRQPIHTLTAVVAAQPIPPGMMWDRSAPMRAQLGAIDLLPNLLLTTLAVVSAATPSINQWFASAPQAQYQNRVDNTPNTLVLNQTPPALRSDVSALQAKYAVEVDTYPNTRVLNQLPPILRADYSAPVNRQIPAPDIYQNLLTTTLVPIAVQNPFLPVDTSQWQGKYNLEADVVQRPIALTQTPPVVRHDYRAPQAKWNFFEDKYQNLLSTTLKQVPFRPVDTSSWQARYGVEVDQVQNLLNLQQKNPIPLPLGLPFDMHPQQVKFQVQADQFVNMLILGYPVPPPVTTRPHVINIGLAFGPFGGLS